MLKDAHVVWILAVVLMGWIAIRQMWRGYRRQFEWQTVDQNIGSYFVAAVDLEIALGIALWVIQGRWDGIDLLPTMRHPTVMLAAWVAVRFGWYRVQQTTISESKFLRATIFFGIGSLAMIIGTLQIYQIF